MDIGQGAGLAAATGVRPFLPTLLAGAMARGDLAIDFDGSGWQFLESPGFLLAVFALSVIWYGAERSRPNRGGGRPEPGTGSAPPSPRRRPAELAAAVLGVVFGALLFAGSLAAGDEVAWPGLAAGIACALLAHAALGGLFERAGRRLEQGAAGLLVLYAEGAALLLAGIAILVPQVSFLALAALLLLLLRGRREEGRKYAGLRVLR